MITTAEVFNSFSYDAKKNDSNTDPMWTTFWKTFL